jgi:hypothetical protein
VFYIWPHTLATAFTSLLAVAMLLVLVPYAIRVSSKFFIAFLIRAFHQLCMAMTMTMTKSGLVLLVLSDMPA